jgi:UDP-N-acetylglucosamine diphosphorylase / glucose-1-phosphate thymidylyltransferase / UDP-N-acetylgalactosamine diphosphorylase / glucosamine-1-phosphate N-acetyltransferase / galactosamine-1-phosphate N-acetyltransferase
LPAEETILWGREEVSALSRTHPGASYNEPVKGEALLLNSRATPTRSLEKLLSRKGRFALSTGGKLVAARVKATGIKPGVLSKRDAVRVSKSSDALEVDYQLLRGCWDLVASNGLGIAEQAGRLRHGRSGSADSSVRGSAAGLRSHESAEVEPTVLFDTRAGPIVIDEGATIESFSRISGPCYVGRNARIKGALLRSGTSVFEGCRVGGEVENSIIMPFSNKSHFGYVGDSIVGEWVNLGAGSTFSNLKNTYGNVRVDTPRGRLDTGLTKLGPTIGDMSKVSIGCLVFSGMSIGTGSQITGTIKENVPAFTYRDGGEKGVEILLESALETQRRMMERRGRTLTKAEEEAVRRLFAVTMPERRKSGVVKGRFS